jgi:hypothetical protein
MNIYKKLLYYMLLFVVFANILIFLGAPVYFAAAIGLIVDTLKDIRNNTL